MPKTVFITGASSGFGKLTAQRFHDEGWNVVATMRNPEPSQSWTAPLERLIALPLDVTKPETIGPAVEAAVSRFGTIDVLINNAGYGLFGVLEGASLEEVRRQFETNVIGLVAVTQAVLPIFREKKEGVIVNLSSMAGKSTFPLLSAYNGTKWAVEGLTEALQYELSPFNIRLKLVEPGAVKTDFASRSLAWSTHPAYVALVAGMKQKTLSHMGSAPGPEKVVSTILRAATDGSGRLRYSVHAQPTLFFRSILPQFVWRWMMNFAVKRVFIPAGEKELQREAGSPE